MCAHASPESTSSPLASTGRSLFARLTSPLRPRTRNLADFHIQPHEPHRRYSPGDLVKGIVVLTVVKPIRITHLTVSLHGLIRVFKNPTAAVDPLATEALLTASANSRRTRYFGNGQASLFHDEVILCGEGRLEIGVYEFEFELEFPSKGLPSSIDFERGTISYMIRSTITRPTTIAATTSCDRKVALVESVDIGPIAAPKPRIISLEPISRKRRKHKSKPKAEIEAPDAGQVSDAQHATDSAASETSSIRESTDHTPNSPRSPLPSDLQSQSEHSGESVVSSSTGISFQQTFRLGPAPASTKLGKGSQGDLSLASSTPSSNKTITTTIELLKGGCLAGENIPLRISIQHTKWLKSMHGIIITLYRQGRIDSAPAPELFEDMKGKGAERQKHEDYYPKSKTGLGGLSLSSAGSSSVFRKDLSQTLAPIIIDPKSLSTVVTASLRIPEDAFPTIRNVPGEMISFKYCIEVVVDLGGKLAGNERHLPGLGKMTLPSMTNPNGQITQTGGANGMLSAWGGNIVNTDAIRREKSVVACLFEIVVGTTDSARVRGRGNTFIRATDNLPESPRSPGFPPLQQDPQLDQITPTIFEEPPYPYDAQEHRPQYSSGYDFRQGQQPFSPSGDAPQYVHLSVPPPDVLQDEALTDKERARRAEERLLPSQPPQADGPSSSSAAIRAAVPSAPEAEDDLYGPDDTTPSSAANTLRLVPSNLGPPEQNFAPSAPALDDMALVPSLTSGTVDDKQELERQRLMAEASSPGDFPAEDDDGAEDDNGAEGSNSAAAAQLEPSAPVLSEANGYGEPYSPGPSHAGPSRVHECLPRYER